MVKRGAARSGPTIGGRMVAASLCAAAALAGAAWAGAAGAVEGPSIATDNVEARLVAEVNAAEPGSTILVGLHKIIRPHWHTYWRNAGDAGEPTQITFNGPDDFAASEFIWPLPSMIDVGGVLTNYGYENEVLLPLELTVPADARPGETLTLDAYATWLVCEDICIPEDATLTLDLPIAAEAEPDSRWGRTLEADVAEAPRDLGFAAGLARVGETVQLTVADTALESAIAEGAIRNVEFYPFSGEMIVHAADQTTRFGEHGLAMELTPNFGLADELKPLDGVLAFEEQRGGEWARRGVVIGAAVGAVDVGALAMGGGLGGSVLQAMVFAIVGGLILNLMPCVFPVLSMKALSVVNHAHGERAVARQHGLAFLAGVLATFAILAAVLIGLKAAGAQRGWGFQLQSPVFVTAIAVLFFAIGLNLLGLFEVGSSLQNVGGRAAALKGPAGSFAVGALAVLAASPCTAPFMSAALPVALSAPAPQALAIFMALGLGFAAPFALLSFFPAWGRVLPKPGAWMDRFKQFLAFPMFATAIWLIWVLGAQAGPNAVLAALALAASAGFLIWTYHTTSDVGGAGRLLGRGAGAAVFLAVAALVVASYGGGVIAPTTTASTAPGGETVTVADAWSTERVAELRAEGRPVFVDFTAAWCITCQFNKRVALQSGKVQDAFAATGTAQLVADWTNRNAAIANELARYDRSGVPLYLLFPPEGEPVILNEILTEQHIIDALERVAAAT